VTIVEAPNDEVVARIAPGNASSGNVRSETLRAFTEDEYRKIIASLPGETPTPLAKPGARVAVEDRLP